MNDPLRDRQELKQARFVRWVIASFVIGFCFYAGMKIYQVSVAMQVWEGQPVPISDNPKLKPAR